MAEVDVFRERPPAYGRCKGCNQWVEWVTVTSTGRKLPVNAPLETVRVHAGLDGRLLTVIDGATSHFATCPEAQKFRKSKRRKPVQPGLF